MLGSFDAALHTARPLHRIGSVRRRDAAHVKVPVYFARHAEDAIMLSRRGFLWLTGAAAGLSVTRVSAQRGRGADTATGPLPPTIAALTSMRGRAKPITADERRGGRGGGARVIWGGVFFAKK
jgi:hypothetical protein